MTIPQELRKQLGIDPGDKIHFTSTSDGIRLGKATHQFAFAR